MKFTFKELKIPHSFYGRIIYYDATCNLCAKTVEFIRRKTGKTSFEYLPLQYSEYIAENPGTIVYSENNTLYKKSDAVLKIIQHLKFPFFLLAGFVILPRFIRDPLYDFVARNRSRWFGKCESCQITPAKIKRGCPDNRTTP